jgi:hypothetical protein
MHFVMHMCRITPTLSSTDANALDVGGSRAALALVLQFEAHIFVLRQHLFNY